GRTLGGPAVEMADAEDTLRRAAKAAHTWHDRMKTSSFNARPATVAQLSWALRRDLRRTADWLPDGPVADAGAVARLRNGTRAVPHDDHLVLDTDAGPRFLRLLTVAQLGFPTTELALPGGEWLQQLTI